MEEKNINSNPTFLNGWHPNTELSVNLKTVLRNDCRMTSGKEYLGILRRDSDAVVDEFLYRDAHLTFVEVVPPKAGKRNPRVFDGEHITITRHADGSLHPNFRPMKAGADFSVDGYAISVCNELRKALKGLIER